ncbi:hypothetical protein D7X74_13075 [Corallococcus sp. CA047B]|nr:hypothetical protein D7X74_13075 [Corallococcus sp. CA047B]
MLLGLALTLGACGKDEVEDPGLQPGAQGAVDFKAPESVRLKLSVKAGQRYRFVCEPATLTGCLLQLRDAQSMEPVGEPRGTDIRLKWWVSLFWTASADGPVVMELQSNIGVSEGEAGQFKYQFTEATDDVGGSVDEAVNQPVTETGTSFEGFLEFPTDVDAWRLSVPADHILRVRCMATESGTDPDTEIIRPDGTSLGTYNYNDYTINDGLPFMGIKNVGGGDLILLVRPAGPWFYAPRYACRVSDAGLDDHGDVAEQATVVTVPERVDVTFGSRNDVDVLAADLIAGHVYLFKDATFISVDIPIYCGTTVTDAQGVQQGPKLATNGEGARFTAPTSGRYFLALERTLGKHSNWIYPVSHQYEITDVTP